MDAERLAALEAWENEMMQKHGWYAHMVGPSCECEACGEHDTEGDTDSPTLVNYHTHGLTTLGHTDLQIVLPINPNLAMSIFHTIVGNIKDGQTYEPGETYHDVLGDNREGHEGGSMPVAFALASEGADHPVLRVIIPDEAGCVDREAMDEQYAIQWEGLTD
tara:strand:- start:11705 stop:12190 length:486 start_codon:yes stop_codon:yes gene_type:complete